MAYADTPLVKILTGVRRSGKSTILKMIEKKLIEEKGVPKEQIISYRFDSMEYDEMTAKQMFAELKRHILFLLSQNLCKRSDFLCERLKTIVNKIRLFYDCFLNEKIFYD